MARMEYQDETGLLPPHTSVEPPVHGPVRLTIPALEALESGGNEVLPVATGSYSVRLTGKVPTNLIAVRIARSPVLAIRTEDEPEYPNEIEALWWEQVDFSPCPQCGAPLVWYEAGYAPGYSVCAQPPHHHVLVLGKR